MDEEKKRSSVGCTRIRSTSNMRFMWADNCLVLSHSKEHQEQMLKYHIEEAGKMDLEPKPASLLWTST